SSQGGPSMRTKPVATCLALTVLLAVAAAGSATDETNKAAPAKPKVLAIVGGDVYTVTREVIRNGTVLVQDGKILRVGQDLPVPDGATIIDAKGKYVTPGFVAVSMAGVGVRSAAP